MSNRHTEEEERIADLTTNESIEVLWNALWSALEADLSGMAWPGKSKAQLEAATENIEAAMKWCADGA